MQFVNNLFVNRYQVSNSLLILAFETFLLVAIAARSNASPAYTHKDEKLILELLEKYKLPNTNNSKGLRGLFKIVNNDLTNSLFSELVTKA